MFSSTLSSLNDLSLFQSVHLTVPLLKKTMVNSNSTSLCVRAGVSIKLSSESCELKIPNSHLSSALNSLAFDKSSFLILPTGKTGTIILGSL